MRSLTHQQLLIIPILSILILAACPSKAQHSTAITRATQRFGGSWYNKKEKRHLQISYETSGYMTVNEWVGSDRTNIDAYRAFIKEDLLVMPAYKSDPIRPYTDMLIRNGKLWYRCKCGITPSKKFTDSTAFIKMP